MNKKQKTEVDLKCFGIKIYILYNTALVSIQSNQKVHGRFFKTALYWKFTFQIMFLNQYFDVGF